MTESENHRIATIDAIVDTGNLNPWKDLTIKWKAHGEFHDGWTGLTTPEPTMMLDFKITERKLRHHVPLWSVLHHSWNFALPSPPQKKSRLNLINLLDQCSSTELYAIMEIFYIYTKLLGPWNVANATRELKFLALFHFNSFK